MNGDSFTTVHPGDPLRIPAAMYNTLIEMIRRYKLSQLEMSAGIFSGAAKTQVLVRNSTASDCSRFAVLCVAGVEFSPDDDSFFEHLAFTGVVPDKSLAGRFAVLTEPIAAGELGRAVICGLCPVKVNIVDTAHRFADVTDSETDYLTSSITGAAEIIWAEEGTGLKWTICRLGVLQSQPATFWAKITGNTPLNGSGTAHATDPTTKWSYTFAEVEKTSAGYDGWQVKTGGRTGVCYNAAEVINATGAAALLGNGVVLGNLDYDGDGTYEFAPQPCPTDSVVEIRQVVRTDDSIEYWFTHENGIDGSCD